jgi:hypothetical protein
VSYNFRRTLVAIVAALIAVLVVVPLVYDIAGVRTNLEESVAPSLVAQLTRKTRTPRPSAPTPGPSREPTLVAQPSPLPLQPTPTMLNGVPIQRIILISDGARANVHDIFARGQSLGRNPRAISKLGDSTMVYPPFLAVFDRSAYRLGRFNYLQGTIEYLAGTFGRTSIAVKKGMHTWSQFDPAWAIPELCGPEEGPLACELRLNNPSIAIIRLGANDIEAPGMFQQNLTLIVKYCLARGIIPVLGTKPDHTEGQSNLINNLIRNTASAYSIPLWDYDLVAATVPGRGLEPDHLHMKGGGTRDFSSAAALQAGDALEDLTGLMMLDALRREIGADSLK